MKFNLFFLIKKRERINLFMDSILIDKILGMQRVNLCIGTLYMEQKN